MSGTLEQIKVLVGRGAVRISDHGYDELAADGILVRDVVGACLRHLSLDDAFKLDDVREALRRGDVRAASRGARLFTLTPVAV